MEKIFGLVVEFAKDNGVGISIPIAFYIVFKVVKEDLQERLDGSKDAGIRNRDAIATLEVEVASLKATVKALEKVIY